MTVNEIIGRLSDHIKINPEVGEHELRILIYPPEGAMGYTPSAGIKSLSMGFDWDRGVYFIHPDTKLIPKSSIEGKNQTNGHYCPVCNKPYALIINGAATTGDVCKC